MNFLVDNGDQASVLESAVISHHSILQAFMKKIERQRAWTAISTIVRDYDMKIHKSTELLDVEMLELIKVVIGWLTMDGVDDADPLPPGMRRRVERLF
jgi:hypothetical protein